MKPLLILLAFCSTAFAQFGLRSPGFVAGTMVPAGASPGPSSPGVYSLSTNQSTSSAFLEVTNDAGTGANRLRLAFTTVLSFSSTNPVVVWDGDTRMTLLCSNAWYADSCFLAVYYRVNPPEGNGILHATNIGGASSIGIFAATVTNAHQSTTFGTISNSYSATGRYLTNVTASSDNWLNVAYDCAYDQNSTTVTNSTGQTLRGVYNVVNFETDHAWTTQPGAAGTVTDIFNWTRAGAAAMSSFGIKPP